MASLAGIHINFCSFTTDETKYPEKLYYVNLLLRLAWSWVTMNEATTPEIVKKIHDLKMGDGNLTMREISRTVGISNERVHTILHHYSNMKELSMRWALRLLTFGQQRDLLGTICSSFNGIYITWVPRIFRSSFKKNKWLRFVTVDKKYTLKKLRS